MIWLERIRRIRGFPYLVMGLVLGVALLILSGTEFLEKEDEKTASETASLLSYEETLTHKIEQMANAIRGVSEAEVLLVMDTGTETVLAQETSGSDSLTGTGGTSGYTTFRNDILLASGGDPVTVKEVLPQVRGVAVVCYGGDNPDTELALVSMLTATLGIPATRVYIGGK